MQNPKRSTPPQLPKHIDPIAPPPGFAQRCADELGIEFDEGDLDKLAQFLALLLEANKAVNLTAITDPAEAWDKHIYDALSLVPLLASELPQDALVADLGSGGGVPAIPLAICLPTMRFTLMEATGKKADILNQFITRLHLTNARVESRRIEQIAQDRHIHRGVYDAVTVRALGHLAIIIELALPLLKWERQQLANTDQQDDADSQHETQPAQQPPVGLLFAVKGAKADEELQQSAQALKLLRAKHIQTIQTPTGRIVVIEKTGPTDRIYPRRDGEPKRTPLGLDRTTS